jgi:tetratricopeptide (TPR) repeat protein
MKYLLSNNVHPETRFGRLTFFLGLVQFILMSSSPVFADDLSRLEEQIDSWHLTEAGRLLEDLDLARRTSPRARYLAGKLLFYKGDHSAALLELRQAIEGARAELGWKLLRDRASSAEQIFAGLKRVTGKSGRFVYKYAQGPDALLIPYAEETLTRQLKALAEELGDQPDFTIEIDFMPDVESLAKVSGLTVDQIERTGTVGITKFSRVMIITPRKLAAGYPWLDTLAHELTHLIITRASNNKAPIWLHEGIAKVLERRWRGERLGVLTPEEAYLLDRAAREGRLIPLRRFHPSIAHLPDQEDAVLAYAQVLSFIRYLENRLGAGWLREMLIHLGNNESVDTALTKLSKFNLQRLYLWWRQLVSGRRQTPVPAVGLMKRRFKRGEVTTPNGQESVFDIEVRKHLRIGDLLRLRGHIKGAVAEYRMAEQLVNSPSPEVSDRLAACLLETGDAKAVIDILPSIAEIYPSHSTVFIQLGQALYAEERLDEAAKAFSQALSINPFHPDVHCVLAEIFTKLGRVDDVEIEAQNCRLIAAHAPRILQDGETGPK